MESDPLAQRRVGRHEQDAARAEGQNQNVKHVQLPTGEQLGSLDTLEVHKDAMRVCGRKDK